MSLALRSAHLLHGACRLCLAASRGGALRTAGARPSTAGRCIAYSMARAARGVAGWRPSSPATSPAAPPRSGNALALWPHRPGLQRAGACSASQPSRWPQTLQLEQVWRMLLPQAPSSRLRSHQGASTSCRAPEPDRRRQACQASRSRETWASSSAATAEGPAVSSGGPPSQHRACHPASCYPRRSEGLPALQSRSRPSAAGTGSTKRS